ncbi:hypothetical protein [Actinomadura rubrisoli]|nr:hypothetical protein [Actinomadura rubrisoli]
MPTQPKKIWPTLASVVLVVFAFNNPEKAAQFVNQAVSAIERFANALG